MSDDADSKSRIDVTPSGAGGESGGGSGGEPLSPSPPQRGMFALMGSEIMRRWGARIGGAWLVVLVLLAVFAPLIANSHPILRISRGQWSTPMLEHLTAMDVILLVGFVAGVVLWRLHAFSEKAGWGIRWLFRGWIGLMVVVSVVSFIFVSPPENIVYSEYREAKEQARVDEASEYQLLTVIRFSPMDRLHDQKTMLHPSQPTLRHWMGTTTHGEDLMSRMIHATRIALVVGFIATGIAVVIGVIIGGVMGYFSGWVDLLGMRVVEVFSAIPTIFLLITFVAFYGRNLYLIMVIIGLTSWVGYALFVRAEFLKLRQQDFVQAARACGLPLWSVLFRHMLPNGIAPVLVNASFGVASAILTESTLSFLGLGLVEEPSWGQLLNQARVVAGGFYWWIALYPGLAIFLTVFSYNLIGEALRDAIDPRLQQPIG